MATLFQIINKPRIYIDKFSSKLKYNPQKKAVCLRIYTMSPKKPNSANRRVARVNLVQYRTKLIAKLPGEGNNLQQHSTILIKNSRVRDLISVSYAAIRGKYDFLAVVNRKTRRSLFGVKKNN
jgi:small subunit ribosomal protein S12